MSQVGSKSRSTSRKKTAISYVIRDVEEKFNRAGVNALRIDPTNQVLYTAGRDSIIRAWDIHKSDKGVIEVRHCVFVLVFVRVLSGWKWL